MITFAKYKKFKDKVENGICMRKGDEHAVPLSKILRHPLITRKYRAEKQVEKELTGQFLSARRGKGGSTMKVLFSASAQAKSLPEELMKIRKLTINDASSKAMDIFIATGEFENEHPRAKGTILNPSLTRSFTAYGVSIGIGKERKTVYFDIPSS